LRKFATTGDLITNNWKENPNGEGYRRWLSARRRSDLLGLVDDTLAPRLAELNGRYAARYGARIEAEVRRIATQGMIDRAYMAGAGEFNDPALKAHLMAAAHARGPAGARAIMNAAVTGRIPASGRAEALDPEAVKEINSMDRAELMRRLQLVRSAYDQNILGDRQSTDKLAGVDRIGSSSEKV
jgi:hypothetical protein